MINLKLIQKLINYQNNEPFEVKLFANKSAAKYFKRRPLPTQVIESLNQDGTMEFVVKITHKMEILPIIKYWIPHLQVISPNWISDIIENDLKQYLQNNRYNKIVYFTVSHY